MNLKCRQPLEVSLWRAAVKQKTEREAKPLRWPTHWVWVEQGFIQDITQETKPPKMLVTHRRIKEKKQLLLERKQNMDSCLPSHCLLGPRKQWPHGTGKCLSNVSHWLFCHSLVSFYALLIHPPLNMLLVSHGHTLTDLRFLGLPRAKTWKIKDLENQTSLASDQKQSSSPSFMPVHFQEE